MEPVATRAVATDRATADSPIESAVDVPSDAADPTGSPVPDVLAGLEALAFGLVAVTSLAIEDVASHGELTFQQWRILVVLGSGGARVRVSDVAARIGASGPSASRLIRRLRTRGLVEVRRDETDQRSVLLSLSPAGVDLRRRILARRRVLIQESVAMAPRATRAPGFGRDLVGLAAAFDRWL